MSYERSLDFRRYDSGAAGEILETVVRPLFVATHSDVADRSFYGADRFVQRMRGHAKAPGFELVVASVEGKAVGQSYGYALQRDARWWKFLTTPIDQQFIEEDGRRTFALCELMVHPTWQRHGIAHKLHNEILQGRPEARATLLVREDNLAAQEAYAKWGWWKIGKMQPFPDSPHFDVLMLDLANMHSAQHSS